MPSVLERVATLEAHADNQEGDIKALADELRAHRKETAAAAIENATLHATTSTKLDALMKAQGVKPDGSGGALPPADPRRVLAGILALLALAGSCGGAVNSLFESISHASPPTHAP